MRKQSSIILSLIVKLEKKFFKVKNFPNSYVPIFNLFDQKELTSVQNIAKKPYVRLDDEDLNTLRNKNFDLLFRIGWGIIKSEVLDIAKHGI